MRKLTSYAAPGLIIAIAVIFFMPAPGHDRPEIEFRPDPPEQADVTTSEPTSPPAIQRLLPPDKQPEMPWETREREAREREVAGNRLVETVYVRKGGDRYHKAGCRFAKEAIAVRRQDAEKQGFTPCQVCGG